MKTRLLTAAVALPLLIAAVLLPWWYRETVWLFAAIAVAAVGAALFEFFSLTKKQELKADASIGYLGAAGLAFAFLVDAPTRDPDLLFIALALFVIILLVTQTFRFRADLSKMLTGTGVTLLGVMYIVFLGGYVIATRVGFDPVLSSKLLLFYLAVMFGSDSGQYFSGRAFGKHKLAPAISPNKTIEGLVGGLVAAGLIGAVCSATFFPELKYAASIPLAIVMAAVGALGDLAESAFKRGSKTKDTASILPGHGGLLDRLDSLLVTAPILYYFAKFYF